MNDDSKQHNSQNRNVARSVPSRPPVQWPERKLPDTNNRAAEFARSKLAREYINTATPKPVETHLNKPRVVEPIKSSESSNSESVESHTLRNQPYDWQQYHNAWQQYYHQYFYRYYAGWWQQQKQQLNNVQTSNSTQNPGEVFAHKEPEEVSNKKRLTRDIQTKIRSTVKKNAERVQSSTHFKPLLIASSVAAMFLLINYNQVIIGAIKQYVAPGSIVTTPVIVEPNVASNVGPNSKIIIPKIGVEAPVVYDEPNVDEKSYQAALERGVVRLGNTADPGTVGNVVIGGHSSNNVFNPGKYKYVFVNLKRLELGDILYLNYNGRRYTYKVTVANKIIAPSETDVLAQTSTPTVTLFTCDPPGTNVNRLIVQATQIDPDPSSATTNQNKPTKTNSVNPLPSVAPSLWDRLFNR